MNSWTKEEVDVLKKCVENNPGNMVEAFENASAETGRSPGACGNKWYTSVRNGETKYQLKSRKSIKKNGKNTIRKVSNEDRSIFEAINILYNQLPKHKQRDFITSKIFK